MGRWHAWAVRKAGGSVVAIADPEPARTRQLADDYPDAQLFENGARMVADAHLDVLHVCTPRATHYELAAAAIAAAVPVLIEKPLATTAAETEQLLELATARGVLIAPVHQYLFQDGVLRAYEALERVGPLVRIAGTFYSAGGQGLEREQMDSMVVDILPHPLSLMQRFLRSPLPQQGWMAARSHPGELQWLGDASGTSLSILISLHARPTVCALDIVGTNGTIHLNLYHGYAVIESGRVSRVRKITHPFDLAARTLGAASLNLARRALRSESAYPGLLRLVRAFHDAVRLHGKSPISATEALQVAQVRERLSAAAGMVPNRQQSRDPKLPLSDETAVR